MPIPLTRTPAPALDFSRPGTPAAENFGDIYFSTDGGLAETRAVFLGGCGLPDGWMDRDVFTVAELGFGSGLNWLATLQSWRQSGATGRLHFISVEAFPFERGDLARALAAFPELGELSAELLAQWPGPVRGVHRLHFGSATLTLVHDGVEAALASQEFAADAWFLDGFSPAKNPDMWSDIVLAEVARLSTHDARLASFTVAGFVRRGLEAAGFSVSRLPGFGRKRHRLEARFSGEAPPRRQHAMPTIIGAGIAGASVAQAFRRRGYVPRVLFDPAHVAASGNAAALVKPRLDLQDNPASRFFLQSYLYSRHAYAGAVLHEGVVHRPKTDAQAERFSRIAAQEPLGPGALRWENGQLCIPDALVIDPAAARAQMLDGAEVIEGAVERVEGPAVVCAGYGIRALMPELSLRWSRGQLSWADGRVDGPVTYGGYALPMGERVLLGATHDRLEPGEDPFALRPGDDQRNLEGARAQGLDVAAPSPHRAGVRVNTRDTFPRMAKAARDVTVLTGLGSRGFVFAPLLGEAVVCDWLGEPSPLSLAQWVRLTRPP